MVLWVGFEGGQADDTSAVNQTSVSQRRLMGPGRPKRARHRETPDPSPATWPGRLRPRCAVHEAVDAGWPQPEIPRFEFVAPQTQHVIKNSVSGTGCQRAKKKKSCAVTTRTHTPHPHATRKKNYHTNRCTQTTMSALLDPCNRWSRHVFRGATATTHCSAAATAANAATRVRRSKRDWCELGLVSCRPRRTYYSCPPPTKN